MIAGCEHDMLLSVDGVTGECVRCGATVTIGARRRRDLAAEDCRERPLWLDQPPPIFRSPIGQA
jgi:hypothetical protein